MNPVDDVREQVQKLEARFDGFLRDVRKDQEATKAGYKEVLDRLCRVEKRLELSLRQD